MNEDYAADSAALKEAADGLDTAMSELKSIAGAENGELGDGFSDIALTGLQVGHEGLRSALARFGTRWEWGVHQLIADGDRFAGLLGLAAGSVHDNNEYVKGTFKDLVVDGYGNPEESDADAEKYSLKQSLHQDLAPDETTGQLRDHAEQSWKAQAADEIRDSPAGSIVDRLSGGAATRDTAGWVPDGQDGSR